MRNSLLLDSMIFEWSQRRDQQIENDSCDVELVYLICAERLNHSVKSAAAAELSVSCDSRLIGWVIGEIVPKFSLVEMNSHSYQVPILSIVNKV